MRGGGQGGPHSGLGGLPQALNRKHGLPDALWCRAARHYHGDQKCGMVWKRDRGISEEVKAVRSRLRWEA